MYLLYIDESGQPSSDYFVLAGVALYETDTYWLADALDRLQREFFPDFQEAIPFHASEIRSKHHAPWTQLSSEQQHQVLDALYKVIADSRSTLFGIAIERGCLKEGEGTYQFAFESMVKRFDGFLIRRYKQLGEPQRGLVIVAESQLQQRIETLAMRIRREGTRWGQLYNLAEVPLFTLASNSRLLQIADACANAVFGRYERGITRQFDKIVPKFDAENGIIHGLRHYCVDHQRCHCPACLSRRLRAPDLDQP